MTAHPFDGYVFAPVEQVAFTLRTLAPAVAVLPVAALLPVVAILPPIPAIAAARTKRTRSPAERKLATISAFAILTPVAGLAAAIALSWGTAFNWTYLFIALAMTAISGLGITVGFHRLVTHKSFKTPALIRYAFAAAGSMAVQGPVIRWCAEHRRHHHHSDTQGDPHSPHMGPDGSWGQGFWATMHGAYHAHVGWMFSDHTKGLGRYSVDLRNDPVLALADRQFLLWVAIGLAVPALLGGLLTMSWIGLLLGFLWGGLVRILFVHHITWSVNSICHLWGTRPFNSHDHSRNNLLVGVLGLGEGWHNNHHAFPTSARHGLRWWELDLSYLFILTLKTLHLAREVKTPDHQKVATMRKINAPQVATPTPETPATAL